MASKPRSDRPLGTEPLWGFTSLPPFFRSMTRAIAAQRGHDEWQRTDLASAIRTSKAWAGGSGAGVSAGIRAQAAGAVADWERKKAEAASRRAAREAS